MIRSDCGTENCSLATSHMMRHNNDEFSGEKSYRYGSSTTNTVSILLIYILKICIYIIVKLMI